MANYGKNGPVGRPFKKGQSGNPGGRPKIYLEMTESYLAPSGVLMIGAALLFRDLVQRTYGIPWSIGCIFVGTALSAFVAPPALAIASGMAFLMSELSDFAVYTPLARKRFILALVASCMVGAAVDSALFLWLAFGSLDHMLGQIIGFENRLRQWALNGRQETRLA